MSKHVATWRNVSSGGGGAGAALIGRAGDLFNRALDSANKQYTGLQDDLVARNTEEALNNLRGINSEADFAAIGDSFTPETLSNTYGAGNIDLSKIGKQVDVQGTQLKDAARKSLLETRADSAYADTTAFNKFTRGESVAKAAREASLRKMNVRGTNLLESQVTDQEQYAINQNAYKTAQDLLNTTSGTSVDMVDASGTIDPTKFAALSEQDQTAFLTAVRDAGGAEIQNFSSQSDAFSNSLSQADVTGDPAAAFSKQFADRRNAPRLSAADTANQKSEIASLQGAASKSVERLQEDKATMLSRFAAPAPTTFQEKQDANNALLQTLATKYDDPVLFSYLNKELGGGELVSYASDLLSKGISVGGTTMIPSAAQLEFAILAATTGKAGNIRDISADKNDINDALSDLLIQDPLSANASRVDAVNRAFRRDADSVNSKSNAAIKKIKQVYRKASNTVTPNRNANIFAQISKLAK